MVLRKWPKEARIEGTYFGIWMLLDNVRFVLNEKILHYLLLLPRMQAL